MIVEDWRALGGGLGWEGGDFIGDGRGGGYKGVCGVLERADLKREGFLVVLGDVLPVLVG